MGPLYGKGMVPRGGRWGAEPRRSLLGALPLGGIHRLLGHTTNRCLPAGLWDMGARGQDQPGHHRAERQLRRHGQGELGRREIGFGPSCQPCPAASAEAGGYLHLILGPNWAAGLARGGSSYRRAAWWSARCSGSRPACRLPWRPWMSWISSEQREARSR